MPTVACTVVPTPTAPPLLDPTETAHATDVADAHAAVLQSFDATAALDVRSTLEKPRPLTVTMPPDVGVVFSLKEKLTTGAAAIKQNEADTSRHTKLEREVRSSRNMITACTDRRM